MGNETTQFQTKYKHENRSLLQFQSFQSNFVALL